MKNNIHKTETNPSKAIRLPRVCELTGASRATIWRWMKMDPTFPRCFHLSVGVTVWDEAEIYAWIEAKRASSYSPA